MPDKSINLIPSEIIQERSRKSSQKKVLNFGLGLLFISLLLVGVAFYLRMSSASKIKGIEGQITSKKAELASFEDVERLGTDLTARLGFADTIFNNNPYYSRVLDEIDSKNTAGVVVTNVEVVDDLYEITISGEASNTNALQNYVTNLVQGPDNLFSDAKVLEVNIKEGTGTANFKVSVVGDSQKIVGNSEI